jgi:hypothetical protein
VSPSHADIIVIFWVPEAFAATGWRVGWLIGPQYIIQPTLAATTRIVFCSNSPLQEATAVGLEKANSLQFFETQRKEYTERRQVLIDAFDKLGLKYTFPEGSYFILLVCTSPNAILESSLSYLFRTFLMCAFRPITHSHRVFWVVVAISGIAGIFPQGALSEILLQGLLVHSP